MVHGAIASIDGQIAGIDASHPAALAARDELFADLKSMPELRTTERDAAGSTGKGASVELTVWLASAGSITAFARIVRIWLERDRRRSLTVSISEHETGRVIKIEGEKISTATLAEALQSASRKPDQETEQSAGSPSPDGADTVDRSQTTP